MNRKIEIFDKFDKLINSMMRSDTLQKNKKERKKRKNKRKKKKETYGTCSAKMRQFFCKSKRKKNKK